MVLRLQGLRRSVEAESGGLLRILFLRDGCVSAGPDGMRLLLSRGLPLGGIAFEGAAAQYQEVDRTLVSFDRPHLSLMGLNWLATMVPHARFPDPRAPSNVVADPPAQISIFRVNRRHQYPQSCAGGGRFGGAPLYRKISRKI